MRRTKTTEGVGRAEDGAPGCDMPGPGHSRREPTRRHKGVTMRSGKWSGLAVAIALAGAAVLGGTAGEARADGWLRHTIPRETLALDYRTGDVMMAPPIPYGCY